MTNFSNKLEDEIKHHIRIVRSSLAIDFQCVHYYDMVAVALTDTDKCRLVDYHDMAYQLEGMYNQYLVFSFINKEDALAFVLAYGGHYIKSF